MRNLKTVAYAIFLVTTTPALVFPQNHLPKIQTVHDEDRQELKLDHQLSYDEILTLLNDLESGELEKRCSLEELDRINEFLATLAQEGTLPGEDEIALAKDIQELFHKDSFYEYAFSTGENYEYVTLNEQGNIIFCKHKNSNGWGKIKKFAKKHKKAIIIGAAVVVAITVVIVAVAAASAATAAVAAGAASAAASSGSKKEEEKQEKELPLVSQNTLVDAPLAITGEAPVLKEAIEEHVTAFKEFMLEDKLVQQSDYSRKWDDLSFGEKTRELGAYLAHQAFDGVSELANIVPRLYNELEGIAYQILPESLVPTENITGSAIENYETLVTNGHKAIDKVFSSDHAELYTPEFKANNPMNDFAIGMIPLPGQLSKIFSNTCRLIENGKILDRAGFTKAGRGLMKHGYREDSIFPKPLGTPAQVNEHGQKILESIVNHPERKYVIHESKRLGKTVDIFAPDIGGVRYSLEGDFIGFLELQK